MADAKFDLKFITEFDGSMSVVDWIERVELTCHICQVKQVELVIPLQLLYNYGTSFYINHFSLIIFYHSVWLGFELFGS